MLKTTETLLDITQLCKEINKTLKILYQLSSNYKRAKPISMNNSKDMMECNKKIYRFIGRLDLLIKKCGQALIYQIIITDKKIKLSLVKNPELVETAINRIDSGDELLKEMISERSCFGADRRFLHQLKNNAEESLKITNSIRAELNTILTRHYHAIENAKNVNDKARRLHR